MRDQQAAVVIRNLTVMHLDHTVSIPLLVMPITTLQYIIGSGASFRCGVTAIAGFWDCVAVMLGGLAGVDQDSLVVPCCYGKARDLSRCISTEWVVRESCRTPWLCLQQSLGYVHDE